jgi:universal stress protein A
MNISIHRILFPTDFSESARTAQRYAMALAEKFGAELHLIHVVPPFVPYSDVSAPWVMPENEVKYQVDAADQRLRREIDSQWQEQHTAQFTAVSGFAVDEILQYAQNQDVDLIVLGTHGHSGLSRLLIGSVAEKLVRTATCPVLTVHPEGHQFVTKTDGE